MDGAKSNKRQAEARPEVQSSAKRQNVTMGMDTLDCPNCSKPLRPPIFQYPMGDFICLACCGKLPKSERIAPRRCYGMERVVNSIFIPCKHGCATKLTSYQKEEHEDWCPEGPCFCLVSGCSFAGKTAPLLDHLTTLHKLPTKTFKYFVPFDLRVQPGSLVLHGGYGLLFLLEVASLESLGHSVSLVCDRRHTSADTIKCSVGFSCFEGHYQLSSLDVGKSLLSDELPTQYFCVVPKVSGEQTDVVLRITIDLLYDIRDHEVLEDEDDNDDCTYNQDEDDNMTTKKRMVITELVVKKYADDNIYEEEDDDNIYEEESDDEDTITTTRTRWIMTMTNEEKEDGKDDGADDHSGD